MELNDKDAYVPVIIENKEISELMAVRSINYITTWTMNIVRKGVCLIYNTCFPKESSKEDCDKEQVLIDQWATISLDCTTLLHPKTVVHLMPLANRQKVPPGMKSCVTTLYLDVNGQLIMF